MLAILRRVAQQVQRAPRLQRGMAGDSYIPKPDTHLDHVFGDSNFKLPFNFQPMSTTKTLALSTVTFGVVGFPIWFMWCDEARMQDFLAELEAAKARKAAASS